MRFKSIHGAEGHIHSEIQDVIFTLKDNVSAWYEEKKIPSAHSGSTGFTGSVAQ